MSDDKDDDNIEEGLTNRFGIWRWGMVVVFAGLASSILYARNSYLFVGVNPHLTELGVDVFFKYTVLVVAVERAAAVFVGIGRNQNNVDWSLRIHRINEVLQKENPPTSVLKQVYARERRVINRLMEKGLTTIDDVPDSPTKDAYIGYLTSAKHAYEFQRARFESVTNSYVASVVFVVGVILAALGLSLFQDLFHNPEQIRQFSEWQGGFLRLADIFVTGGLLGGGSAGLNAMANKVTVFLNRA